MKQRRLDNAENAGSDRTGQRQEMNQLGRWDLHHDTLETHSSSKIETDPSRRQNKSQGSNKTEAHGLGLGQALKIKKAPSGNRINPLQAARKINEWGNESFAKSTGGQREIGAGGRCTKQAGTELPLPRAREFGLMTKPRRQNRTETCSSGGRKITSGIRSGTAPAQEIWAVATAEMRR
jgi:hypothetical protein